MAATMSGPSAARATGDFSISELVSIQVLKFEDSPFESGPMKTLSKSRLLIGPDTVQLSERADWPGRLLPVAIFLICSTSPPP